MYARILLRLKRTFLHKFLPNAVVGAKINMFKELSVEHFVDNTRRLFALYLDFILVLGIGNSSNRQKCH